MFEIILTVYSDSLLLFSSVTRTIIPSQLRTAAEMISSAPFNPCIHATISFTTGNTVWHEVSCTIFQLLRHYWIPNPTHGEGAFCLSAIVQVVIHDTYVE